MYRAGMLNWKGTISVLNLLLLVMLFFYLTTKECVREKTTPQDSNSTVKHIRNFSYKNNKLLDQEHFSERLDKKRAYSVGEAMTNFLACITEDVPPIVPGVTSVLDQFRIQFFACMSLHIPVEKYELDMFKAINYEHKYFLPMDKAYYNNPSNKCLYLTIGIGNHTQAEQEFLKLYPACKLFGVELVPSNVGDFGNFGKIINAGIGFGAKPTVMPIYRYMGFTHYNLTLKPFYMILDQEVGSRLLHYATIDIEGTEYDIMKEFEEFGQYHTVHGIVICQIDIELHLTRGDGIIKILRDFFHNAPAYLPVFAAPYAPIPSFSIMKLTVINIKDSECELAFRFSKYFQR